MKSFKEFLNEANAFKKGNSVTVKNAKKYDALAKDEVSGVIDMMMNNNKTAKVKVGTGSMNVDVSDLVLAEDELSEKIVVKTNKRILMNDGEVQFAVARQDNGDIVIGWNKDRYFLDKKETQELIAFFKDNF